MYYQTIGFMIKAKPILDDITIDPEMTCEGKYVDKEEYTYTSFSKGKVYNHFLDAVEVKTECEDIITVGKTISGRWSIYRPRGM